MRGVSSSYRTDLKATVTVRMSRWNNWHPLEPVPSHHLNTNLDRSFSRSHLDFHSPLSDPISQAPEGLGMGRGVSSGGGQSSLGYLFGGGEAPKPAPESSPPAPKPSASQQPVDNSKLIPAGIQEKTANNYFRADGQNSGNFITDRPSTKVHSAPGGGSSLGYLFGNGGN